MTDEKKKQLFPFFAYMYSKQLNPEKYGRINNIKEWTNAIKDNTEDINTISKRAAALTDEEWDGIDQEYANQTQDESGNPVTNTDTDAQYAKKGAKLKELQEFKKGKKIPEVKKCGCGCDMIDVKEEGGKISSHCSCKCGGKVKKESKIDNKKLDYLKKIKK